MRGMKTVRKRIFETEDMFKKIIINPNDENTRRNKEREKSE